MLTQCTTSASHTYGLDLAAVSFLEAFGIDLPCNAMLAMGTTLLGITISVPVLCLALAIQNRI